LGFSTQKRTTQDTLATLTNFNFQFLNRETNDQNNDQTYLCLARKWGARPPKKRFLAAATQGRRNNTQKRHELTESCQKGTMRATPFAQAHQTQ
jgi:hypothetical protein